MRSWTALVGLVVALGAAACSGPAAEDSGTATDPQVSAPPTSPAFTAAPSVEVTPEAPETPTGTVDPGDAAAAATALPVGAASGEARVTLVGLGQLASTVSGTCTRDGGTTTVALADGAGTDVTVVLARDSSELEVVSPGLEWAGVLTPGEYSVAPPTLRISALVDADGGTSGQLDLDVRCGV